MNRNQIVWHSSLLFLLPLLLLLLSIATESGATKLNLTETCADREIYFCTVTNVTGTYDDPLVIANSTQDSLMSLVFRDSVMHRMPREVFKLTPNMFSLVMHNCGLSSLTRDDFNGAKSLKSLILQENRFFILQEDVFAEMYQLNELRLSRNTISIVHRTAFERLSFLHSLDLQQNAIRELPSDVFAELIMVEYIDLSNNELQKIDANLFRYSRFLHTILLSGNAFHVFEPNSLEHLPHLHLLDLCANNVDELYLQSVDTLYVQNCGLTKLSINGSVVKIRAGNNQLEKLHVVDTFSVRELELRGNSFTTLDSFVGMDNLQHLDLSKNKITTLHTIVNPLWMELPGLTYLNLASNKLESNLGFNDFFALQKLVHLDLSFNDLRHLDVKLLEPVLDLEKLYIEGNQLHQFEYENFVHSHAYLRELGIFANDWDYRYLQRMMNFFKETRIQLPVRFINSNGIAAECQNTSTNSFAKSLNTADEGVADSVSGIHPYWTMQDILAMVILIIVFFILMLQLYTILKEEGCLHSRCCERIEQLRGTTSPTQPQRLHEDDSEV